MYDGLDTLLGTLFLYGAAILIVVLIVGLVLLAVIRRLNQIRKDSVTEFTSRTRTSAMSSVHLEDVRVGGGSRVTLNGMTFVIKNGRVTVNGQPWGPVGEGGDVAPLAEPPKVVLNLDGTITGPIQGDLIIEGPGPVTLIVQGNVEGSIEVRNGNVQCGAVKMSVEAGGDVRCGDVGLSVEAQGNVTCGNVHLSVEAGGNVYRK